MNVVFPRMVGRTDGRSVVWDSLEVACQSRHRKRERSPFRQFRPNERQATRQKKPTFVKIVRLVDTRRSRDPDPIDDDAPRMPQVVDVRCQPASVVPTGKTVPVRHQLLRVIRVTERKPMIGSQFPHVRHAFVVPPDDDRQARSDPFARVVFVEGTQRPVFRADGDRIIVAGVT